MSSRVFGFICLLPTVFLLTISMVEAQQPKKVYRIGFLGVSSASAYSGFINVFRKGLRELGYVEGHKSCHSAQLTLT